LATSKSRKQHFWLSCAPAEVVTKDKTTGAEGPNAQYAGGSRLAGYVYDEMLSRDNLTDHLLQVGTQIPGPLGRSHATKRKLGFALLEYARPSKQPRTNGDAMALTIQTDPIPLRFDEHGVVRVGDSQVLLDIVIQQFNNGAEPEAIAQGYPSLNLADVYGVIAYYLRHRNDIDDYIRARRQQAEKLRQEIEGKQPSRVDLRAKLLARKAQMELAHASPGN
jgi:uncharacterized protein (DUF433 family)